MEKPHNMETNRLEISIQEVFDGRNKYIVPLYQRNFAWRRGEIERLLHDIYEAYRTNKTGNYFIGSLIVLKRSNGDYEVIDGQQRLTTLSLITKILEINQEPRLFYDSRPEVEEFFREFYNSHDGSSHIDYPQTFHLKNAIEYIKDTSLDASGIDDIKISDKTKIQDFKKYFANNVILVRVEIPQDTDVASYFEIMNNRGEQLQKHEILKSLLMSRLEKNKRNEFALIWDACSQMDIPIQKLFEADGKGNNYSRDHYFGDRYDQFVFNGLTNSINSTDDGISQYQNGEDCAWNNRGFSINAILSDTSINGDFSSSFSFDEDGEDESEYKSIIDFPNFLMHILQGDAARR